MIIIVVFSLLFVIAASILPKAGYDTSVFRNKGDGARSPSWATAAFPCEVTHSEPRRSMRHDPRVIFRHVTRTAWHRQ